jgi:hypothetical protein
LVFDGGRYLLRFADVRVAAGRLYEIAPEFITDKTERILDFGYCLLRMKVGP